MGRPRQISDEQILSVMRRHVRAEGPNVPLHSVASELGVTVPALLKRFGTRQELMLAALKPPLPEWLERVERGPDDRPLQVQLTELFGRMLSFFAEYVPCMVALRESGISPHLYTHHRQPLLTLEALHHWLRKAKRRGLVDATELETCAQSILSALQGRSFLAHCTQRPFSEKAQRAYATELAQIFTRALSSKSGHARHEAP